MNLTVKMRKCIGLVCSREGKIYTKDRIFHCPDDRMHSFSFNTISTMVVLLSLYIGSAIILCKLLLEWTKNSANFINLWDIAANLDTCKQYA